MRFRRFANQSIFLVLFAAAWAVASTAVQAEGMQPAVTQLKVDKPQRVLFMGNSYLYYNDSLHNHVRRMVAASGIYGLKDMKYKSATISGSMLFDHDIDSYLTPGKLRVKDPFQVVVMQGFSAAATKKGHAPKFEATVADRSGQVDQVLRISQQLVDDFAGTPAGSQGMIVLGNRYFSLGRYADAQRLFRQYLDTHGDLDALVFAARTGLAACREAQGDLEGAARDYVQYADDNPVSPPSALALMQAARCYGQLGDAARRRETLERVTRQHPLTPVAQRAREQLTMMM